MKWRTKKKRIRRNAEYIAGKIPLAFKNRADRDAWIKDIVTNHPALKRKERGNG